MITHAALAPRPRSNIAQARFGAGVLLYETAGRRMHTLNTSAALVWRRLDGLTTLWQVSAALAEMFAADRAVIEGDVAAVVDRFGHLGLLAGDDEAQPAELPSVDERARVAALRAQLDARTWPITSLVYHAVGLGFRVRSEEPSVAEELDRVLRPLRGPDDHADHAYSVRHRVHDGEPQWRVYFDGQPLGTVRSADAATALVLWHLDQATLEHTAGILFFQGGAVQVGERVVLFPGASGRGTSTLTTAVVRRGLSYLADGIVPFDVAVGRVLAFPRSISLGGDSDRLFPDLLSSSGSDVDRGAGRWYLDPAAIPRATVGNGGRVALVVMPHFVAGSTTRLERVVDVDALRLLLDHTFPFDQLGARGFHALVALARQAAVYRLQHGDVDAASEVVLQLVREIR